MHYLNAVNTQLRQRLSLVSEDLVLFGQNISRGSCLSGLTRHLPEAQPGLTVINSPNAENTLVGLGMGLMLNQVSSVFFMKQLDFLLLGIDHLVNTWNMLRNSEHSASFTIFPIVVDLGFQGPQSSFNNLSDLCALADIPGFSPVSRAEIEAVLTQHLIAPGLRLIAVSQRLFNQAVIDLAPDWSSPRADLFQYGSGSERVVVAFNFSLPYGLALQQELGGPLQSTLFNVTSTRVHDWGPVLAKCRQAREVILVDDSKRQGGALENLLERLGGAGPKRLLRRSPSADWYQPSAELFVPDPLQVLKSWR